MRTELIRGYESHLFEFHTWLRPHLVYLAAQVGRSPRAQGSGAGIWCGAGAALSPIPLVLGFLEPILKGWSKPVSTPPRPLQSFRHICPGSFSFMLLAASLLSALFAVSLHSMFVTDGPCVCVHLLLVSSFGCSLEGSGSTHFCGYDVF